MMSRFMTAQKALEPIRSGQHIVVGSGAAEPQHLVEALAAKSPELSDAEVLHLLTLGSAPYAEERFAGRLRHNALFIGPNVRGAVQKGLADYTPCFLSEIPGLMRSGRLPVDAALIQVAPVEQGVASLGVAVDIVKAAVEAADYVVAQVNPKMPWTLGDSFLKESDIDALVFHEEDLIELPAAAATPEALWIGRHVARLVEDGDTLQAGIGAIPDAVLAALAGKKDLGVHSEMLSDGLYRLWKSGAASGARKSLHPGKVVATFAMGSRELYQALDRNPSFELYPADYVNNPMVIAKNDRMVAINSALQVDLTGQVCSDSLGTRFYSGFGGQVDFIRGAAWSAGGRSIIALPSTAKGGAVSRIAATLSAGAGVVTTRADVDFVVTEYGIASLKGKTIRERAVALLQISHPTHRAALVAEAKKLGFLDAGHVIPVAARHYRSDLETRRSFGGAEVLFRPLKPSDERRLKDLFYSQSADTTYRRFGAALKRLSERQFQELVAIDYRTSLAIGGFVTERGRVKLIAVGRYGFDARSKSAEAAFAVHDDYQGRGIGTFLLDYLAWIAREEGIESFTALVLGINAAMRRVFDKRFRRIKTHSEDGCELLSMRLSDWKGSANPAEASVAARAGP